jgi:hypothetical protein
MNETSPANGASVAAAAVGATVGSTSGPAAAVGTTAVATAVAAAVGTDGVAVEHAPNTRLNMAANGKTRRIDKRFMISP